MRKNHLHIHTYFDKILQPFLKYPLRLSEILVACNFLLENPFAVHIHFCKNPSGCNILACLKVFLQPSTLIRICYPRHIRAFWWEKLLTRSHSNCKQKNALWGYSPKVLNWIAIVSGHLLLQLFSSLFSVGSLDLSSTCFIAWRKPFRIPRIIASAKSVQLPKWNVE